MEFVDFAKRSRGRDLGLIFPGWAQGENVAFYSPHDDDVVLGGGHLLQAVLENGGNPSVLVFCRGDAGYSTPEEKETIVAARKKEALEAYGRLGVGMRDVIFLDFPDFGLMPAVGRDSRDSRKLFDALLSFLRIREISRIVFSSGHLEHWDHTAVYYEGVYTSPQAGDPILADLGPPFPIKTYLAYAVWTDFEAANPGSAVRADKGVLGTAVHEEAVRQALKAFASQGRIMEKTIAAQRDRRRAGKAYLELFQTIQLRTPIDYRPYFEILKICQRKT